MKTRISLFVAVVALSVACAGDDPSADDATDPESTTATTTATEAEPEVDEGTDENSDQGSDEGSEENPEQEAAAEARDVAALVVRQVTDAENFESTRDAYVADLEAQAGIVADREFQPFISFLTFGDPEPPVFIGLTQGSSLAEFQASADAVGGSDTAAAYFETFDIELFDLLVPLDEDTPTDIADIAVEPGNILEVAWRDLNTYDDLDPAAYAEARDAYLAELATHDGWVAEYQWESAVGSGIVVGMTVYEDQEAFLANATDEEFNNSDIAQAWVGGYPLAGGYAATVIK
ncbi:MAG: hypothetical protein AAGE88_02425 [Actinomycetota bacterium]